MKQLEFPMRPASVNAHFFKDINDVCQVDGCGRTRADGRMKRGYCAKHYFKLMKYGDPNADFRKRKAPPTQCAALSCERTDILARGFCNQHYSRWRLYGDADAPDRRSTVQRDQLCVADECDRNRTVGELCGKHYHLKTRYGDFNYQRPARPSSCVVDDCTNEPKGGLGYCVMHYGRLKSNGDPLALKKIQKYPEEAVCAGKGCDARPTSRGLCPKHAWRRDKYGHPDAKVKRRNPRNTTCSEVDCDAKVKLHGLCAVHVRPILRIAERHAARRRRGRKRDAFVFAYSQQQVDARMAYFGHKCWMCGGPFECVDHVKPLILGGKDCPSNFRPACKSCNSKKRDKWYGVKSLHHFLK